VSAKKSKKVAKKKHSRRVVKKSHDILESEDKLSRLDKSIIAMPLLDQLDGADDTDSFDIIIDLNLLYRGGLENAKDHTIKLIDKIIKGSKTSSRGVAIEKSKLAFQYIFAQLTKAEILNMLVSDAAQSGSGVSPAIYKIWPDFEVEAHLTKSVSTVKADAARVAFSAIGKDICWAVIDTGIDGEHPHFKTHDNLDLSEDAPLKHLDLTGEVFRELDKPEDNNGHGTHVAGIIAGEGRKDRLNAVSRERNKEGDCFYPIHSLSAISGVAPKCKLISLKVLDNQGKGRVSNLITALGYVHQINGYGRWNRIQGVNMSVGYGFDAEWFACGQSPLCVEVDRLVRSGVVVVVAAGNTGYGWLQTSSEGPFKTGLDLSINDPGNAELAITVGATHREMPHTYGVSYFSSKGPTGDGRLKPDLVAPGEKIISCAAGSGEKRDKISEKVQDQFDYREESGTSMAAPHVSGAIAAFLSIRREFIGRPTRVKEIFLSTATDLNRERYFQGRGLVDLMRALQSV
jgi:subtilisin family serine protease